MDQLFWFNSSIGIQNMYIYTIAKWHFVKIKITYNIIYKYIVVQKAILNSIPQRSHPDH